MSDEYLRTSGVPVRIADGTEYYADSAYLWLDESDWKGTTIDAFKLLPKVNCKECGFPTCMAFAMCVNKKQRKLSDCTRLGGIVIPKEGKIIKMGYEGSNSIL